MEKRYDSQSFDQMVKLVEQMTGKTVGSDAERSLLRGADEIDLVRSGLEETMITAYDAFHDIWKRKRSVKDLRTAAFVCSIEKIGADYVSLGIFP